jgi:hypothetical protein
MGAFWGKCYRKILGKYTCKEYEHSFECEEFIHKSILTQYLTIAQNPKLLTM